tara:strand:+ start:1271 stop:1879 length:609 start_codon:yes stop_codon:yes gene_type:complete
MIKYGLISETDGKTIEATLDLLTDKIPPNQTINTCCIGIYNGDTDRGIVQYLNQKGYTVCHTAIDNEKDKPVQKPVENCILIIGDSTEVYHKLADESIDFLFVDGCHCMAHVVADFFCYSPKIKTNRYILFHDTGEHISQFKDFQHGDKENPFAYISVRRALERIGLLDDEIAGRCHGFELIFDEADETDEAGGICVFKKLY